jgi:ADP-ribose pyrophosphatase YjhB (NUDIX family)
VDNFGITLSGRINAMLSYVQELIIGRLITSEGLRYSKLRPEDVDDDLYNYHLQELVKKGYVEKNKDNLYVLSDKGKEHAQKFDAAGKFYGHNTIMIAAHVFNEAGEVLMQKRPRHPYKGDIYPGIAGKVLPGESFEEASSRKLAEETGLECIFTFIGAVRSIRRQPDGSVFEDSIYHHCVGNDPQGELLEKTVFGEHFWASIEDADKYQKNNVTYTKEASKVLRYLKSPPHDCFYLTTELIIERI